jgi:hypothetical protein
MSTVEFDRSRALAAQTGRLRVGCWACDFVGDLTSSDRPPEADIHRLHCPECGQVGGMHEYPTVGAWPSDYPEHECPVAPDPA